MTRLSYVALIERNVPDHLTGVTDLDIRENASGTPILNGTDYIATLGPQGDMPQLYRLTAAG